MSKEGNQRPHGEQICATMPGGLFKLLPVCPSGSDFP